MFHEEYFQVMALLIVTGNCNDPEIIFSTVEFFATINRSLQNCSMRVRTRKSRAD